MLKNKLLALYIYDVQGARSLSLNEMENPFKKRSIKKIKNKNVAASLVTECVQHTEYFMLPEERVGILPT